MAPDIREVVHDLLNAVLKRIEVERKYKQMCLDIIASEGIDIEDLKPEDIPRVTIVNHNYINGKTSTFQFDGVDRLHLIMYAGTDGFNMLITSDPITDHLKTKGIGDKLDICKDCPDRDICGDCQNEETSDGETIH